MEKRLLLFAPVALAILYVSVYLERWRRGQLAADRPDAKANVEPGKDNKTDKSTAKPGDGDKPADKKPAGDNDAKVGNAGNNAPEKNGDDKNRPTEADEAPEKWFTLGSVATPDAKASPYEMLVTFNSRGAAVERVELASDKYLDLDDRSGYLGNLALTADAVGCKVNVVGDGTPAAAAGIEVGDVITQVDGQKIVASEKRPGNPQQIVDLLSQTKPRQSIEVVVARGEATKTFTVKLERRPLAVIRPELDTDPLEFVKPGLHDPFSFLLTLKRLDDESVDPTADKIDGEIAGLHLRSRSWQGKKINPETIEFTYDLPKSDLQVVKRYRLAKIDPDGQKPAYHLALHVEIRNTGKSEHTIAYQLDGPTGLPTEGWWYSSRISPEMFGGAALRDVAYKFRNNSEAFVSTLPLAAKLADEADAKEKADKDKGGKGPDADKPTKDDGLGKKELDEAPLVYAGVDAQYFASMIMPDRKPEGKAWFSDIRPMALGVIKTPALRRKTDCTVRLTSVTKTLAAGDSLSHDFMVFVGPKQPDLLAEYPHPPTPDAPSDTLAPLVYYGWFGWVSRPMVAILGLFYRVVHNYGLSIIMLTVLVRLCMFPLSRKQSLAAKKMQELQPEMKRINERYKDNAQEKTRAMQELWRKHNYNPLGGCMLAFVQLPIFMGLYRSLMVNVELRGASLFGDAVRWCSNLAAPDMFWHWADWMPTWLSGVISSETTGWFGPYLNILPLITVALFTWQQAMFMPPATDETTAMQQKMMRYMTLFMGVMFFKVAAGLCIYFIASSAWGMTERTILGRTNLAGGAAAAGPGPNSPPARQKSYGGNGSSGASERERRKQRGKR